MGDTCWMCLTHGNSLTYGIFCPLSDPSHCTAKATQYFKSPETMYKGRRNGWAEYAEAWNTFSVIDDKGEEFTCNSGVQGGPREFSELCDTLSGVASIKTLRRL